MTASFAVGEHRHILPMQSDCALSAENLNLTIGEKRKITMAKLKTVTCQLDFGMKQLV